MEVLRALFIGLQSAMMFEVAAVAFVIAGVFSSYLLPLATMGLAALFARICCLAIWLAWGRSSVLWRSIVVFFTVSSLALVILLPIMLSIAAGIALICALPRIVGYSRVNLYEQATSPSADVNLPGRFRLVDLFAWTTMVAVWVGFARWLAPKVGSLMEPLVVAAALAMLGGILSLLAIWAILMTSDSVRGRVRIALTISAALGALLAIVLQMLVGPQIAHPVGPVTIGPPPLLVVWTSLFCLFTTAILIAMLHFLFRENCERIVRHGQIVPSHVLFEQGAHQTEMPAGFPAGLSQSALDRNT